MSHGSIESGLDQTGVELHGHANINIPTTAGTGVAISDPFQEISADFVHVDSVKDAGLGPRHIMLVPGGNVAALALDLPKGLRGQNREQVARRQLRDQVGIDADITEMRPFQTRASGENWSRVLVTDRALVDGWRERAGAACRAVLPDYLALPTAPALWTIATTPSGVAVRLGPQDGFGAPTDTALALLDRALLEADPAPKALLRLGLPQPQFEALFETAGIPVITDIAGAGALGLSAPRVLGYGEPQLDLRRDPKMARAVLAQRVLPWRWPLLLGIIAAVLWAASQWIVIERIRAESTEIKAATTALVQEHFVTTGPVLDARVQVSQALARLQAEVAGPMTRKNPMQLFNQVAQVVTALGAKTQSAIFAGDETLALVAQVADFAAAELLVSTLRNADLDVTVVDTRVNEGARTVRAEMKVSATTEPVE